MSLKNGLRILDFLASQGEGVGLLAIADALGLPRGTCHRVLAELVEGGYVRQLHDHGRYILTMRMTSNGLEFLSLTGIADIAQPIIERIAARTGELARLSLVDGDAIIWVGKADGQRTCFRYDPDMGQAARLSCTSTGHAWLMTMTDEQAVALVLKQGFGQPNEFGPHAPTTLKALLGFLHAARVRGYAMIDEVFAPRMSAVATPVVSGSRCVGVISLAGPRARLTAEKIHEHSVLLREAANELAQLSNLAGFPSRSPLGKA
ncbi:Transcriptional regulator, IclR family [Candidatus Burkholderia verschuerenii]|uniref:Transcriptional regulator, IclR family n=1 Tax=Candidatus Burkholderia verschuerenii TaxID=242163 RepID=A0A0L0MFG4_9BURK|nr:IclR family transcriptional regulator [Candidatus Burkholderia verschuerenii]KND61046.1 Transcriptional regulator, IclR family [Candidatus Burkholderia verschuerenii]